MKEEVAEESGNEKESENEREREREREGGRVERNQ